MWGALAGLVDWRGRVVLAAAAVILVGCAGSGEESSSRPNVWIHFSKERPKESVRFGTYAYGAREYSTSVTILSLPEGAENPCEDPTMPEGCIPMWAGPRRVGDVSSSDWRSLQEFMTDERWATYEADSQALPEGVGELPDEVITVWLWEPSPSRWVSLVPTAVLYPETGEMLDTLAAMQRRWHASGEYMTEWDRQRESEDVWPVP